jgi:hypothetical protein
LEKFADIDIAAHELPSITALVADSNDSNLFCFFFAYQIESEIRLK